MQHIYSELNRCNVHWNRIDANHIVVWTNGINTARCVTIEEFMLANGIKATKQYFDRICGKTKTIYKHD